MTPVKTRVPSFSHTSHPSARSAGSFAYVASGQTFLYASMPNSETKIVILCRISHAL